ncbi:hypothetical protein EYS14_00475 [Alteromonadaceae bacterium M269]|nr:hypothetical protein EYS14_00475 [Alteromonadaceae bacterium M269]
MKFMMTGVVISVATFMFVLPASASENAVKKEQPIAQALSKKINKEIRTCMENGTKHTHAYEQQKHLKMMMPKTYEKCEQGVSSACQMTASVLAAMETNQSK